MRSIVVSVLASLLLWSVSPVMADTVKKVPDGNFVTRDSIFNLNGSIRKNSNGTGYVIRDDRYNTTGHIKKNCSEDG
ncbi:hypothetical protein TSH100_07910 [Azospirillum sp. TSH100]|uniref:hypothetical protein n=1 Tax=Azospirillum sp. TSH100 TaxID=652764 RepID=UPI000D60ADE1|nr:hypothetical protein [Azospirillum sp. TSH100]PWC88463.1 hypothetical protein TSH100_07910 [Azospirillum sp. TSH100]QCG90471.1 hypothetical protein E6C72_21930 [Azospirillum sp. TSH100]